MTELFINPPTLVDVIDRFVDRIERLGLSYKVNTSGRPVTAEDQAAQKKSAVAIIAGLEKYSSGFFDECDRLKTLAKYGVGFDNIDLKAAQDRGIAVSITSGSNSNSVADYTIASILALICKLPQRHRCVLRGNWERRSHPSLNDITIGIIGHGRIGSRVAERAKRFGWRVLAVDPAYESADSLPHVDQLLPLEDVLGQADVVTLHYPKSRSGVDFGAEQFAAMRTGAVFLNMARGGMIDETALAQSLHDGHLSGAAMDVFASEPITNLAQWENLPNVLLSPHVAGSSEDALLTGFDMCLEVLEYRMGLRKDPPRARFL